MRPGDREILVRIGDNIRAKRIEKGWTQAQLAEMVVGVGRSAISNWECASEKGTGISVANLFRLARLFGCPFDLFAAPPLPDLDAFQSGHPGYAQLPLNKVVAMFARDGKEIVIRKRRRPKLRIVAKDEDNGP